LGRWRSGDREAESMVDLLGNLINASSSVGASPPTQAYQYDPLYRLTNVQNGSGTSLESFTYDLTGDRLSKTLSGTTSPYTYTAGTHRLASVASQTRGYDADGNENSGPVTFNGTPLYPATFTYDNRNRLTQVTASGAIVTFNLNGRGERVFKNGPNGGKLFSYDEGGRLLGEYTTTGALGAQYVYVDSMPVAYITGGVLYYIETDQLGTPRQVILPGATTANDAAVWKWGYFASNSAFGENAPSVQTITFNLRFPGQYFDAETGLNYNYFRDYEPGTGRYVESDPIGLRGGPSTYGYANQNSLRLDDPTGLFAIFGCDPARMSALMDAENQICKKLDGDCGCGANTGCIPCKYKQDLLDRLNTSIVNCSKNEGTQYTPWLWPKGTCADSHASNYDVLIYPVGFTHCGCLESVVLHELLHNVGLKNQDHAEIEFIDRRCFGCTWIHPEYGNFSPPSDGY